MRYVTDEIPGHNAFKYGVSNSIVSAIKISLKAEEKSIAFLCENAVFLNNITGSKNGVGILNTTKRLEHLYPGKYDLTITDSNGLYTVYLKINQV